MSKPSIFRRITNGIPLLIIRFYRRFISPMFPPVCRFYPSCSAYGLESFQKHGLLRAVQLTVWRVLRCNPFNPGGFDPVPAPKGESLDPEALRQGELAYYERFGIFQDSEEDGMPPSSARNPEENATKDDASGA